MDRETLVFLIWVRKMKCKDVAKELGVSIATLHRMKKIHCVDARLWWKWVSIYCPECGREIDRGRELPRDVRVRLARQGHVLCDECKGKVRARNNYLAVKKWRQRHRDEYNNYMREYRRERSAGRNAKDVAQTDR